jgi:hypothetical protein
MIGQECTEGNGSVGWYRRKNVFDCREESENAIYCDRW